MEQKIKDWIARDPLGYAYLLDFYRRGARVCWLDDEGLALKSDQYDICYAGGRVPLDVPELGGSLLLLTDDEAAKDALIARKDYFVWDEFYQALWQRELPEVEVPEESTELLQLDNYGLSFEEKLLENVSFSVHSGEKVALVGANGTGKTSMLREIWKNQNPAIRFSDEAVPAFFSQLHAETLKEQNTIYEEFFDLGFETPAQVEDYLRSYCFDPDTLNRRVGHLSGGEKNLLQLAKLSAGQANLLLLDEPSSHLDTFAQIALEDAIAAYKGAVLMVSHDFYTIVSCADTILLVENGGIRPISPRAFRKMIYKKHFSKEYLELELQKKDLETRIARCLESGDCAQAQRLCDKLAAVVTEMQRSL